MNWKTKFNINEIISKFDEDNEETIINGLKEIGLILKNNNEFNNFAYTDNFLNFYDENDDFLGYVDFLLENLYDYADYNKIWLGGV